MPLRIFNNLNSFVAQRFLGINNDRLSKTFARVASGIRITVGADDAAGLALSESLKSDTRTLQQGVRNLNDGFAMINVAEGALAEQTSILIRMNELASQAATGTIGRTERQTINLEFTAIRNEFDRIGKTTEFNGINLLDGTISSGSAKKVVLMVGLNSGEDNLIDLNQDLNVTEISSSNLGLNTLSTTTVENALNALGILNGAINTLTSTRARVGAVQNRFGHALSMLNISIENLTAAQSGIRDADLAEELANLTRGQILVQSAAAMVGQSNLIPEGVLQLLQ